MIGISVKDNIRAVKQGLKDKAKRQLPFAIARALTLTAGDAGSVLTSAMPRQLDRPTPFTMRAIGIKPATKAVHLAKVFIRPAQWKYLQHQIEGSERVPQGKALVLPKSIRLNQYGNMPRRAIKQMLAKKQVFSGTVDGVAGIYMRRQSAFGEGLQLIAGYADRVRYKKRYPFQEIGLRTASRSFNKRLQQTLAEALSDMR